MGHKVHPIGFRIGVIRDWDAKWYSDRHYREYLLEDIKLRDTIRKAHPEAGVSTIEIDRQANNVSLTVHTARPGILIGRGGQRVDELRASLEKLTGKRVQLNIREVPQPELDAYLVARNVADQMERRISYRRVLKQSLQRSIQAGARGMRISCGGRLDGAEIARRITMHEGRVPLHTLRADIDYGFAEARTAMGCIGVKVWLYKGDILPASKEEELEEMAAEMALDAAAVTDIEAAAEAVAVAEEPVVEAEPVAEVSPEAPAEVPAVAVETEQPAETPAPMKRVRKTPATAKAATADTEAVAVETGKPAEKPAPKKRIRKTLAKAEDASTDTEAVVETPTDVAEKPVTKRRTRTKAEPDTDETEADEPKVTRAKAARAKTAKPRATKATKAVEAAAETVSDDEDASVEAEAEAAENQGDSDASA